MLNKRKSGESSGQGLSKSTQRAGGRGRANLGARQLDNFLTASSNLYGAVGIEAGASAAPSEGAQYQYRRKVSNAGNDAMQHGRKALAQQSNQMTSSYGHLTLKVRAI